jgi:hypothetical protein
MPLPTWTPAALSSEAKPAAGHCWRLVEAQHQVSTMKLVDTLDEQALLEHIVERAKPPVPPAARHLHPLLAAPFRYDAEYPRGSRFRRAGWSPGVYYGALAVETAMAELAFHRLLLFADSPAIPWPANAAELTAFEAAYDTPRALDLTVPPLDADRVLWTDPNDDRPCQDLAERTRLAEIGLIRYASVRDPERGANVALLTPAAFTEREPRRLETWKLYLHAGGAVAMREFPLARIAFPRDAFAADPRIAALVWER